MLEKLERVADGLTGDTEHGGQVGLDDALAGFEGAVGDRAEEAAVDLIDQDGGGA